MTNNELLKKWREDEFLTRPKMAIRLVEISGLSVTGQNIYAWENAKCNPRLELRRSLEKLTLGKVKAKKWG